MLELDVTQRRQLTANAHHLNPVVTIGKEGLTKNVISELDKSLSKHELIKVKVSDDDQSKRVFLLEHICQSLNAAPVKLIGKILIIYRAKPDKKDGEATMLAAPRSRLRAESTRRRKPFSLRKQAP